MGYYTDFSLKHNEDLNTDLLVDNLYSVTEYRWSSELELKTVKWYSWQEDMRRISKKYRDVLFTLSGIGEGDGEYDDVWVAYFLNGMVQFELGEIDMCDFDPAKLA